MNVYIVTLETEENTQVLKAFSKKQDAVDFVRDDYDHTVDLCEYDNLIEGETTDLPSDLGATIYFDPCDYWIWSIHECELT